MSESCTLVGNLGNDPEMRFTPNGAQVTNCNLATYAGRDTEGNKLTTWVRLTFWSKLAETVNQRLSKGQKIQVQGYLHPPRVYDKHDGSSGASLEMTCFKVGIVPKELPFDNLDGGTEEIEMPPSPVKK
jgi:single-strand DNA-binding protein